MEMTIKKNVYINRQSKEQKCRFKVNANTVSCVKNILRTNKSNDALARLMEYNDVMMKWLDGDEANMQMFFENPIAAFKKATNAPDELLEACKSITQDDIMSLLPQRETAVKPDDVNLRAIPNVNSTYIDYSQGWDFVSGITQKNANTVLGYFFKDLSIKFHHTTSFSIFGISVKLNLDGIFGIPQIKGGTGSNVSIEIPITSGTAKINDSTTLSLNGVKFSFTTTLTEIESSLKSEQGGKLYDYYINFADKKLITEVQLSNLSGTKEMLSLVKDKLIDAMNMAFAGKEYKLFSVNLNGIDKDYPYMVPTHVKYAFVESQNPDDNVIGVLVQTNGERSKTIQLDANTIPKNCGASVILSNRLAVDGLLRSMAKKEIGMTDDNITVEGLPRVLSAKKTFNFKEKVKGYTPQINKLKLWFADDLLHMELGVRVVPSAGLNIDYSVQATFSHKITTVTDKNGMKVQTIVFQKEYYHEDKEVSANWWVWLLAVLISGVGAIIVLITLAIINLISPSLEHSVFKSALVKIDWNHMDIVEIQHLNTSGHIQIGAKVTLQVR